MLGLRNLYRVFQESRSASRRRVTLAVTGGPPEAVTALVDLLDAQRGVGNAEVILRVAGAYNDDVEVSLSGGAVEDEETFSFSVGAEEAVLRELAPRIAGALEKDYLVPVGRGYPVLRRAVCEEIIRHNARQNAVIGVLPIPGADMPAITVNQVRMVLGIAAAHDEELSMERARELIGVLAAGFGFRALSRQILKLVPVAGWAAAGGVGYAGTLAMGRAAIHYFERGKREPGPEERSEILHRAREEAEAFFARIRQR